MSLSLFSPAKVNVALAVVGKADGYHLLESTVQTISLGDEIILTPASHDTLTLDNPLIPNDHRNTVHKALVLFRSATHYTQPLHITIRKSTPIEAGLGGGSSNCATVLYGLNQLANQPLSEAQLSHLASQVGSDCALFFSSGAATIRGRGEKVESHAAPHLTQPFYILKPPFGLSTPAVYKALSPDEWSRRLIPNHNDLQAPALRLAPELQRFVDLGARLTGSGTAFLYFGNQPPEGVQTWRVYPVMRQPDGWYRKK
jgi:4-diphosphocytidyl-2-C-methyl-D-erythritol kinase